MTITIEKLNAAMDVARAAEMERQAQLTTEQEARTKRVDELVAALVVKISDLLKRAIDGEVIPNFTPIVTTRSVTVKLCPANNPESVDNPYLTELRADVDQIKDIDVSIGRASIWDRVTHVMGPNWKCEDFSGAITLFYYDKSRE